MAELGAEAEAAHLDLGRFAARLDVSRLVVVGSAASGIHAGAVLESRTGEPPVQVDDLDGAVAVLRAQLQSGDVVLVKASRSAGFERIAAALLADAS
jgi:UDP-N-acetylmuramoyl-tripeptide--D-alanyl-D-alanine ligase